jgi:hypothetical protein
MKTVLFIVLMLMNCIGSVMAQSDSVLTPIVVEELKDSDCLEDLLGLEGFLFKTDLNAPNTSEHIYYGLDPKKVKKLFPYMLDDSGGFDNVKYERLTPIIIQALEELNELYLLEQEKRMRLEEDYNNYKITMENAFGQVNYQLELLRSEVQGINEGLSVQPATAK